jgi:hypothetical protein
MVRSSQAEHHMGRAPRVYQEQVQEGTTNSRGCGNPVSGSIEKLKTSATLLRDPLNDDETGIVVRVYDESQPERLSTSSLRAKVKKSLDLRTL